MSNSTLLLITRDRPMRPVTANGDMDLPAWFNVSGYDKSTHLEKVDESGMLASVETGKTNSALLVALTDMGSAAYQ